MKFDLKAIASQVSPEARFTPDALPATYDEQPQRGAGCFFFIFATIWGGIPTGALIVNLLRGEWQWPFLILLVFTVIGLVMMFFGLKLFWQRRLIRLDERFVAVKARQLWGTAHWREEMSSYRGVLFGTESRKQGKASYLVWVLRLEHPNSKHSIQLCESRGEVGMRKLAETWARRLQLPVLERDGAGQLAERPLEALDVTLKERVERGELKVGFEPNRRPPEGITLNRRADQVWEIWYEPAKGGWWAVPLVALFPGILIWLGFFQLRSATPLGIFGIVFLILFMGIFILARRTRYLIELRPGAICHAILMPWGRINEQTVNCAQVEDIREGRSARHHHPTVQVTSDDGSLEVGLGASPEARAWLLTCLVWHVSS